MAKSSTAIATQDGTQTKSKKEAKREAKLQQKIHNARKDVKKAERKVEKAQANLVSSQELLYSLEAKLNQSQPAPLVHPPVNDTSLAINEVHADAGDLSQKDTEADNKANTSSQDQIVAEATAEETATGVAVVDEGESYEDTQAIEELHQASPAPVEGRSDIDTPVTPVDSTTDQEPATAKELVENSEPEKSVTTTAASRRRRSSKKVTTPIKETPSSNEHSEDDLTIPTESYDTQHE